MLLILLGPLTVIGSAICTGLICAWRLLVFAHEQAAALVWCTEEDLPEAVAHISVDQVEFGKGGLQAAHLPLGSLDATI